MTTTKTLMTADELLRMPDDGFRYELVKGELHRMTPAGGEHGRVTGKFHIILGHYILTKKLGEVFAAETGFKLASKPDTVRAPDLAFIKKERLLPNEPKGYYPLAPDLVVEVVSPGDTKKEVAEKIKFWLDNGVEMVVIIYSNSKSVVTHTKEQVTTFSQSDILTLGNLIPGFSISVAEIFSEI